MKFYILTFVVLLCIQWALGKKIKVEQTYAGSMSETDGFKLYVTTLGLMAVVLIIILFLVPPIHPVPGLLLMLFFAVRALIERKYIRATKSHIVSSWMLAVSLVVTILYTYLWQVYYA